MAYRSGLQWMKDLSSFSKAQQQVLLALSHEKYRWRTRDRIASVTGLSPSELDSVLSELMEKGLVVISRSKKQNIIFGLKEIVRA